MKKQIRHFTIFMAALLLLFGFFGKTGLAYTLEEVDDIITSIPADWPDAPYVNARAAVLMDADSGEILYAKKATEAMYPASTTKLLTALLTLENASLTDIVHFSSRAVAIPPGSSHIGMRRDEDMVLKECLLGLLLPSANEAANALAEHVAGSIPAFVDLMNRRTASLGCINTAFANANGLHQEDHYTCCYDLALIMRACAANNVFSYLSGTASYVHHADELLNKDIPMTNTNQMVRSSSEYYNEYVTCGKTGHTEESGYNLVICAEKDGVRLITVVMGCEKNEEYTATQSLLDYGFNYFHPVLPGQLDSSLNTENSFTSSSLRIPTSARPLLTIDNTNSILLPDNVTFSMLEKSVTDSEEGKQITYSYQNYPLGSVLLIPAAEGSENPLFKPVSDPWAELPETAPLVVIDGWLCLTLTGLILLFTGFTVLLLKTIKPKKKGIYINL